MQPYPLHTPVSPEQVSRYSTLQRALDPSAIGKSGQGAQRHYDDRFIVKELDTPSPPYSSPSPETFFSDLRPGSALSDNSSVAADDLVPQLTSGEATFEVLFESPVKTRCCSGVLFSELEKLGGGSLVAKSILQDSDEEFFIDGSLTLKIHVCRIFLDIISCFCKTLIDLCDGDSGVHTARSRMHDGFSQRRPRPEGEFSGTSLRRRSPNICRTSLRLVLSCECVSSSHVYDLGSSESRCSFRLRALEGWSSGSYIQ